MVHGSKRRFVAFQNFQNLEDRSSTAREIFILVRSPEILLAPEFFFGPKYFCSLALNGPSGLDFEPKVDLSTGHQVKSQDSALKSRFLEL